MMIFFRIFFNSYFDYKDWEKGLNNTYIDNNKNKYGCSIKISKSCTYKQENIFLMYLKHILQIVIKKH